MHVFFFELRREILHGSLCKDDTYFFFFEEEQHGPCMDDTYNSRNVGIGCEIGMAPFVSTRRKLHGSGARMTRTVRGSSLDRYRKINVAPSTRMTREKVFSLRRKYQWSR